MSVLTFRFIEYDWELYLDKINAICNNLDNFTVH